MSLSISPFRSWLYALAALIALEALVFFSAPTHEFERTNFLELAFVKGDTPQRLFMYDKITALAEAPHEIVQSGDSSGFYGIEPSVVMDHLPSEVSYVNMSCCANMGFNGYFNMFKLAIERNPAMEYFVLHITPYTMPRSEMWDGDGAALWGPAGITVFGDALYEEFISPVRSLFRLPSLAYRRDVTRTLYYSEGLFVDRDPILSHNVNYLEFNGMFRETLGWAPERDIRYHVPAAECDVPTPTFFSLEHLSQRTYIEEVFSAFADLAAENDVQLVIVFQPVACVFGTGEPNREAREAIARFAEAHPEVEIPFPLIETWHSDMFSVPAHVRREHTDLIGNRLGSALAEIVSRK